MFLQQITVRLKNLQFIIFNEGVIKSEQQLSTSESLIWKKVYPTTTFQVSPAEKWDSVLKIKDSEPSQTHSTSSAGPKKGIQGKEGVEIKQEEKFNEALVLYQIKIPSAMSATVYMSFCCQSNSAILQLYLLKLLPFPAPPALCASSQKSHLLLSLKLWTELDGASEI